MISVARRPETAVVYTATHSLVRLLQVSFFTSCCTSISRLYQNDGHFFLFFYEYTYLRIISHRLLHELLKERLRKQVTNKLNLYYSFPLFFIFVIWYYNTKFLLFKILSPYGMPKYVCRKRASYFM